MQSILALKGNCTTSFENCGFVGLVWECAGEYREVNPACNARAVANCGCN